MSLSRWLLELEYLLEFILIWPITALLQRLSEPRSKVVARGLGRVAYRLLAFDRRWCRKNLELIFGNNLTPSQRTRLAIQAFENIALTRVEVLRWTPEWMASHVIQEGTEEARRAVQEAARQGKGFIIISGHLGNFELISACGYHSGEKGTIMYRPQNNWRVERLLLAGPRAAYMNHTVPRGPWGLLKLRDALREGQGVGLAVDINTIDGGVFVDFLGFQAASPPGAACLALTTGAPVILAISLRQPDGRHRIIFHPPFPLIQTGNREQDIKANTQQYTRAIEAYILANPEQYNWPHPRWRYRPDGSFWKWDMPAEKVAAERLGPPREPSRAPMAQSSGVHAA